MTRSNMLQLLVGMCAAATCLLAGLQRVGDGTAGNGSSAKAADSSPAYRIGAGDILQVDVWREPDVSAASVTVRPDGKISLPMTGEVHVAGLSPGELEQIITDKLSSLIRNPRVTVTAREVTSQRIYLIGEVRREGMLRLAGPTTVLQALAEAGGVTDYAKRNRIYILRMEAGRQIRLSFNYNDVVRGQKVEQNVLLLPGDTIVIPR